MALLPGSLYLWKGSEARNFDKEPDYEIEAQEILKPYFDRLALPPDKISEFQLEEVVASWLRDLASSAESLDDSLGWLQESGLYEALRDGSIEVERTIAA